MNANAGLRARLLIRFFAVLLIVYGALAIPWPAIGDAYGVVYRGVANAVFGSFGDDGLVRFDRAPDPDAPMDSVIKVRRLGGKIEGTTPHDSRLTGYLPTVEVIALILATPIAWRRRFRALAWGLVAVNLFVAIRLYVTLLRWFSGDAPWCLYDPGPFWTSILIKTFETLVVSPTLAYVMPVLIWIAVTFRGSDVELLTAD